MKKQDFLNGLRRSLSGEMSSGEITELIRYYEEYIEIETRKSGDEETVVETLGNPSLLAKSLVLAQSAENVKSHTVSPGNRRWKYYAECLWKKTGGVFWKKIKLWFQSLNK